MTLQTHTITWRGIAIEITHRATRFSLRLARSMDGSSCELRSKIHSRKTKGAPRVC